MEDKYIEDLIARHERGYIWLEKELKRNLVISTAAIAVFFFIMLCSGIALLYWALFFAAALVLNAVWVYFAYRREYCDYQSVYRYLEEFEAGNYGYRGTEDLLDTGIRSQLTEQLERMGNAFGTLKEQLTAEKENTKSLVTDISHQLKTPIAALEMSYELIEDEKLTKEEKQEFLMRGKQEVRKLGCLIETLTNLSRLEADMIKLAPRMAKLEETIVRAVNGIYIKAEDKQIEIEVSLFKNIEVLHDARWTAEAISNVLDNAVKYSPPGTKIQLRVEPQISHVFIEVADEGIGIPKSEYADIFKRFYRGKHPEVEKQEGAGVGLYLVRRIFEEQGGSVRALPAHRKGTVIQMMLPKAYEALRQIR